KVIFPSTRNLRLRVPAEMLSFFYLRPRKARDSSDVSIKKPSDYRWAFGVLNSCRLTIAWLRSAAF
ncbi:hypothetical protein, partial [Enterovibrio coralii]|uniref:hypothetical protein n=1 Tax=Enterovibrio coralii TaxID=294935 RepID=UPI001E5D8623